MFQMLLKKACSWALTNLYQIFIFAYLQRGLWWRNFYYLFKGSPVKLYMVCKSAQLQCQENAPQKSTLLKRALSLKEHAPQKSTLLKRARSSKEHAPQKSTLLKRARSLKEHAPQKSTLLKRACSSKEHAPQKSTLLKRARSSKEHAPQKSTIFKKALSSKWACSSKEHAPKKIFCHRQTDKAPSYSTSLFKTAENNSYVMILLKNHGNLNSAVIRQCIFDIKSFSSLSNICGSDKAPC